MNILVCDDDQYFAHQLSAAIGSIFSKNGYSSSIDCLTNMSNIAKIDFSLYDIALIDIELGDICGIDIARQIRSVRKDTVIIFVTNFLEYAPEGYEVQAYRYLIKSKIPEKLSAYLLSAITYFNSQHQSITICICGENIDLELSNITYFESNHRVIIAHLYDRPQKTYQFYSTMTSLQEKLSSADFLRVHKSYLVNMNYILQLQCHQLTLTNGETLSVSEKNYSSIRNAYILWRGKSKWIIP
ncbi:response regulator transcription factor [Holdemanella sp.]|uniref:LytR/AlgR family response regulator transcription factor n=1 Tax=Holdemanella sp. TaxID=1971762 RepID=UPI00258AE1F7|nr:response regulator transcription factor [Holdemanella sp.]